MMRITKKEKRIFWAGVSTGIVGGIIGNLWVGDIFEMLHYPNYVNGFAVVIFSAILLGLLLWVNKQIKRNL